LDVAKAVIGHVSSSVRPDDPPIAVKMTNPTDSSFKLKNPVANLRVYAGYEATDEHYDREKSRTPGPVSTGVAAARPRRGARPPVAAARGVDNSGGRDGGATITPAAGHRRDTDTDLSPRGTRRRFPRALCHARRF